MAGLCRLKLGVTFPLKSLELWSRSCVLRRQVVVHLSLMASLQQLQGPPVLTAKGLYFTPVPRLH